MMNYTVQSMLSVSSDWKTTKGEKFGYLTGILYLAPHKLGGHGNVCPNATPACVKDCIFHQGRATLPAVKPARIQKTQMFFQHRDIFMSMLVTDIYRMCIQASRKGWVPAIRLNGTSDIAWERVKHGGKTVFELFPYVQFYDYTKSVDRALEFADGGLPENYHITFSRSEANEEQCLSILNRGVSVAAVFSRIPGQYRKTPVEPGEDSDLRFLDKRGVWIGLTPKGSMKKDKSGFVIRHK